MHLIQQIKRDLAEADVDEVKEYEGVTPEDFIEIESLLNRRVLYCYNSRTQVLRFFTGGFIHASGVVWMTDWLRRAPELDGVKFMNDLSMKDLEQPYRGSSKVPDAGIYPRGARRPSIAIEFGYTETYEALKQDADLLLRGTEGEIRLVILVKVEPLRNNQTSIQSGFVELYSYDPHTGEKAERGRTMRLYPPPRNNAQQRIQLSWEDVLDDNDDGISPSLAKPTPLALNSLREIVDENIVRHFGTRNQG